MIWVISMKIVSGVPCCFLNPCCLDVILSLSSRCGYSLLCISCSILFHPVRLPDKLMMKGHFGIQVYSKILIYELTYCHFETIFFPNIIHGPLGVYVLSSRPCLDISQMKGLARNVLITPQEVFPTK